jgi:hypothetical protein
MIFAPERLPAFVIRIGCGIGLYRIRLSFPPISLEYAFDYNMFKCLESNQIRQSAALFGIIKTISCKDGLTSLETKKIGDSGP